MDGTRSTKLWQQEKIETIFARNEVTFRDLTLYSPRVLTFLRNRLQGAAQAEAPGRLEQRQGGSDRADLAAAEGMLEL